MQERDVRRRERHSEPDALYFMDRVEADPDFRAARDFAARFKPDPRRDYAWAIEYARLKYEELAGTIQTLDAKADSVVNYVAAFCGLSLVAFAYQAMSLDWRLGLSVVPTFLYGLEAIRAAVRARDPAGLPTPPPSERALAYVHRYGDASEARFAAQYHVAAQALRVVTQEKARLVRRASGYFLRSVGFLVVPLCAALLIRSLR